jgi:hypothetical protein
MRVELTLHILVCKDIGLYQGMTLVVPIRDIGFVSGHDFQSCRSKRSKDQGFSPCKTGPAGAEAQIIY